MMSRDVAGLDGHSEENVLMGYFRDFYRQVVRLKGQIGQGDWLFKDSSTENRDADELGEAPNAVWQTLLTQLERQSLAARRSGGDFATEVYAQAQYVMAALADEIFLNLEWAGRDMWSSNLLEARLFGTHSAGDTLFERLDHLLNSSDPVYVDLARVYLAALALGFKGRFRGQKNSDLELFQYRQRLLTFITQREALLLEGKESLFPESYGNTLDQGRGQHLPYLRRWAVVLVLVLALWAAVSYPVWRDLTQDLRPLVQQIVRPAPSGEASSS